MPPEPAVNVVLIQHPARPHAVLGGALRMGGAAVISYSSDSIALPVADAFVLGDLSAAELPDRLVEELARRVESGAGLLVLGGPHAFGRGGHAGSRLGEILPVELEAGDDRELSPSGLFLRRRLMHPIFDGLPWDQPPVITGSHRVQPRPGADVLLEGVRVIALGPSSASLAARMVPLLVVAERGRGQVAVLATDLGGPWSAGLAGWGPAIPDGAGGEMGSAFCRLVTRLTSFLAGEDRSRMDPWTAARLPRDPSRMPRTFEWRLATGTSGPGRWLPA